MKSFVKMKLAIKLLPLKIKIGAILIIALFLFITIAGVVQMIIGDSESEGGGGGFTGGILQVSAEVEAYRSLVEREAEIHGISDYVNLILALMMQESGGKGNDPMQASESLCGSIGCITDPEDSIVQGVKHFKAVMESANYDILLGLQSYNFGGGFIDYAFANNDGKYSKELAIEFSKMMYDRLSHTGIYKCHRPEAVATGACYGDIGYVDAVLAYLPGATGGEGGTSIVIGDINSPLQIAVVKNSSYGMRFHPIESIWKLHAGVDLKCNTSDSIHAVKEGVIVKSEFHSGLGNYVKIQHGPTEFTTYGHLSKLGIGVGQDVDAGQHIGMCGSTGGSTGNHLHFEMHTTLWGGHFDPSPYVGL